jgi:hypothetical protein
MAPAILLGRHPAVGHIALLRMYAYVKKWTQRWRGVGIVNDEGDVHS